MLLRFYYTQSNTHKPFFALPLFCCSFSVCSEVFGVVVPRHTSYHLSAVLRASQPFMSAQLVMRADGKMWDSPISPPTLTKGDRLSRDKATGCTFLSRRSGISERECVRMCTSDYRTSCPGRCLLISPKLLLALHSLLRRSDRVFISSSVPFAPIYCSSIHMLPEAWSYFLSSDLLLLLHTLKFDIESSLDSTLLSGLPL